jgi:hypothetical protein
MFSTLTIAAFLLLLTGLGVLLILRFIPLTILQAVRSKSSTKTELNLSGWIPLICIGHVVGLVVVAWLIYLFASLFRNFEDALGLGILCCSIFSLLSAFLFLCSVKRISSEDLYLGLKPILIDLLPIAVLSIVFGFFVLDSMSVDTGTLKLGSGIGMNDRLTHIPLVRSFSFGQNIPAFNPLFSGSPLNYHFFFYFLAGVLEYLGLRLDSAFNLISLTTNIALIGMIYTLGVIISGYRLAGFVATCLFLFRSSFSFLIVIFQKTNLEIEPLINLLKNFKGFIAAGYREGFWNQKVLVDQRHFPFSMVIFSLLILWLIRALSSAEQNERTASVDKLSIGNLKYLSYMIKAAFKSEALVIGILIGISSFVTGNLVIASLLVVGVAFLILPQRVEVITLAAAIFFSSLACKIIILGYEDSGLIFRLRIGFLAKSQNIFEIAYYYLKTFGFLFPVIILGIVRLSIPARKLALCVAAPLIFANLFQIHPDNEVNHKYVTYSILVLNCFAASYVVGLIIDQRRIIKFLGVVLFLFSQ